MHKDPLALCIPFPPFRITLNNTIWVIFFSLDDESDSSRAFLFRIGRNHIIFNFRILGRSEALNIDLKNVNS